MKIGASTILTIIVSPLVVWAGTAIVSHGKDIARLYEREKSNREILIEIKDDMKVIQKYIILDSNRREK